MEPEESSLPPVPSSRRARNEESSEGLGKGSRSDRPIESGRTKVAAAGESRKGDDAQGKA